MQLFGSIAGAESVLLAFDEILQPSVVMAEAPHGTAPRLFGKNVAQSDGDDSGGGGVALAHRRRAGGDASRAIYESVLGNGTRRGSRRATSADMRPPGVHRGVIDRVKTKLDVWASL